MSARPGSGYDLTMTNTLTDATLYGGADYGNFTYLIESLTDGSIVIDLGHAHRCSQPAC